jgi:predicted phosphodiesterase
MKIAVLSDIHANKYALQAVESDFKVQKVKAIWMLGDAFGRGPHPVFVYNWMNSVFSEKSKYNLWVAGNHDASVFNWNGYQRNITPFPFRLIDDEHAEILRKEVGYPGIFCGEEKLKSVVIEIDGWKYSITHEIGKAGYVYPWNEFSVKQALLEIKNMDFESVIFSGHTHVPLLASIDESGHIENVRVFPCLEYSLDKTRRWLINPGSVGAPADMDIRAAYAILDTKKRTIQFRKVHYDHLAVIQDATEKNYSKIIKDQLKEASLADALVSEEWRAHFQNIRENG